MSSDAGVGRGGNGVELGVESLEVGVLGETAACLEELALVLALEAHLGRADSRVGLQEVVLVDRF